MARRSCSSLIRRFFCDMLCIVARVAYHFFYHWKDSWSLDIVAHHGMDVLYELKLFLHNEVDDWRARLFYTGIFILYYLTSVSPNCVADPLFFLFFLPHRVMAINYWTSTRNVSVNHTKHCLTNMPHNCFADELQKITWLRQNIITVPARLQGSIRPHLWKPFPCTAPLFSSNPLFLIASLRHTITAFDRLIDWWLDFSAAPGCCIPTK